MSLKSRIPAAPRRFGALFVIVGLLAGIAGMASMSPANATLAGGSPFDASNGVKDGNSGPGLPDLPTGAGDNSYGQGAKEDDTCPTVVDGSIPPEKADLTNFYVALEKGTTDSFLYLAWDRASTNGTVTLDFELNQSAEIKADCNGVNPVRTVGDLLVTYDLQGNKGSETVIISIRRWTGSEWGAPTALIGATAEGSISEDLLFGEMAINLEKAGIFTAGECDSFASVFVKSRSSSAFPAEMKDFIAPVPQHVSNCGPITVTKTVLGGKAGDSFDFTLRCPTPATDQTFKLADGGTKTYDDIPLGAECSVTEADPGAFWTTTHTINGGSTSTSSRSATVVVTAEGQTVAFTNAAKPNGLTIDKKVNGADHATIGDALPAKSTDTLSYTVVITNSGQVPLTITALSDTLYPGFAAACPQAVGSALAVGASFTCTYQVPAGDTDRHNVATANAVDQSQRPVSASDGTFVDVIPPAAVLGVVLAQPDAVSPAVLPRTGGSAGDSALFAGGLVFLGLSLRKLMARRSGRTA